MDKTMILIIVAIVIIAALFIVLAIKQPKKVKMIILQKV